MSAEAHTVSCAVENLFRPFSFVICDSQSETIFRPFHIYSRVGNEIIAVESVDRRTGSGLDPSDLDFLSPSRTPSPKFHRIFFLLVFI